MTFNNINKDRQWLVQRIENLGSRSCCLDIYNLILDHGIYHMINSNGVFFDTRDMPEDLLAIVDEMLAKYENKKQRKEARLKATFEAKL